MIVSSAVVVGVSVDPWACQDVEFLDSYYSAGDDCVAVKSGEHEPNAITAFATPTELQMSWVYACAVHVCHRSGCERQHSMALWPAVHLQQHPH